MINTYSFSIETVQTLFKGIIYQQVLTIENCLSQLFIHPTTTMSAEFHSRHKQPFKDFHKGCTVLLAVRINLCFMPHQV